MNRPNKKDDPNYPWEFPNTYLRELEKYCDELEKDNDGLTNEISKRADTENALINTISKLEKALDKACKELSFVNRETYKKGTICPIKGNWCTDVKECAKCLKEWLLKDE